MKAIEILVESKKIDEAPAGILGQAAKRVGAAALGAVGLNTWAGQLSDKADVGTFANRYSREFMNYLKGRNRSPDQATFGDLSAFMKQNKIPTHNVPTNPAGKANKDMVDSIFRQTAQEVLSGKAPSDTGKLQQTAKPARQQPAQQTAQQPAQQAASAQRPAQQTASAPAAAPASNIKGLLQQISQLNAKDLAKVEKALQSAKTTAQPKAPATAKQPASAPAAPAQTPAQVRATKQAAAAKTAQAQMKANPAPAKPAPAPTLAQVRAEKQAAATKTAQDQMAPFSKVKQAPKVWKNNRAPDAPATATPTKQAPAQEPTQQAQPQAAAEPASRVQKDQGGRQLGTKQSTAGPNFDNQTGQMLKGRGLNAVRRRSEVGAGTLGKTRAKIDKKSVAV